VNDYVKAFQHLWKNEVAVHWDWIIPLLLTVMAIFWLLTVYRKGEFTFLPALAIARVTVLDSIGRMEVVILLAMGLLFVGIQVIIPNTPTGRAMLTGHPLIVQRIDEMIGITEYIKDYREGEVQVDPRGGENGLMIIEPAENPFDEPIEMSAGGDEPLQLSGAGIEPGFNEPPVTPGGDGEPRQYSDLDGQIYGNPEELYAELREKAIDNLIRQSSFMVADFFVVVIGFILAMLVLPGEMNRGVALSILPKPITRDEYVFGKALGIWIIITVCFWLLAGELYLLNGLFKMLKGQPMLDVHLLMAMVLLPFKYATIVLLTMGGTLRMPEIPATIISAAIFTGGHFVDRIYEIAQHSDVPFVQYGLKAAYWLLPHLSQTTMIILDKYMTLITNWQELWGWVWQIVIYNLLLLWLLRFLFRKRAL